MTHTNREARTEVTLSTLRQAWKTQGLPTTPFEAVPRSRLVHHLLNVVHDQEPDGPEDVLDLIVYAVTGDRLRGAPLHASAHRVSGGTIEQMLSLLGVTAGTKIIAALRAQHDEDGPGWLHSGWTLT